LKVQNSGMMYVRLKTTGAILDSVYIQHIDLEPELLTRRYFYCIGSPVTLSYTGTANAELIKGHVSKGGFQNGQKVISSGSFQNYSVVLTDRGCSDTLAIQITASRQGATDSIVLCTNDTLLISSPSDKGYWSGLSSFYYEYVPNGVRIADGGQSAQIHFTDTAGPCPITDTFYIQTSIHPFQLNLTTPFQGLDPDSITYQLSGWNGEHVVWRTGERTIGMDTNEVTIFIKDSLTVIDVRVTDNGCPVWLRDTLHIQNPHRGIVWDTLQGQLQVETDGYPGASYHWSLVDRFHQHEMQTNVPHAQIPIPFKGTFILTVTTTVQGREIRRQRTVKL